MTLGLKQQQRRNSTSPPPPSQHSSPTVHDLARRLVALQVSPGSLARPLQEERLLVRLTAPPKPKLSPEAKKCRGDRSQENTFTVSIVLNTMAATVILDTVTVTIIVNTIAATIIVNTITPTVILDTITVTIIVNTIAATCRC
uniref:Uncharacterized protein n=1 Tax=Molossus molossus TaxID=27622 RepID=A0A7J8I1N0_MOLMO|nr:hypothetical protein HJG59_010768 [Molossus molossus]